MRGSLIFVTLVIACGKPAEVTQAPVAPVPSGAASTRAAPVDGDTTPTHSVKGGSARAIADDAPLEEGWVVFEGIVRPVKGGFDVRGVTFEESELAHWMANAANDGLPKEPEWFVGARVRVTAVLRQHKTAPPEDGPVMQMKSGTFFVSSRIGEIVLVKTAEVIEGKLGRSKGMFSLAGHLITPDDLAWSLPPSGGKAGDKVRLRGQSRTFVCPRDAQCLTTGSLPLFDIGRAERLP